MTIVEVYIPDPLCEALTVLSSTFKKDFNDMIIELLRQDVESLARNNFESLMDGLKGEIKEHLEAFDNLEA